MSDTSNNTINIVKNYTLNILRIYLFWIIIFTIFRIVFGIVNYSLIKGDEIGLFDLLPIIYHSFALDMSMASYFVVPSFLLLSIDVFLKSKVLQKLSHILQYVFIFSYSVIIIGEIGLYPEWRMKINAKALEYLDKPLGIVEANKTRDTIWQSLLFIVLLIISYFIYKYIVKDRAIKPFGKPKLRYMPIVFIIAAGSIFVVMRGGVKPIPISQSESYFSKYDIVNDISVNTAWNLMYNVLKHSKISSTNIFISMDMDVAKQITIDLHSVKKDTTISILNNSKPNIVFLIMESWSADMIASLGGKKGASNSFDRIAKEGLLFTKCYSSGNRSQQGLASILGGFPALPITTLTSSPEKMRQTETMTTRFNDNGYFTGFYYGSSLNYGNIKAYLIHNRFQEIEEESDMDYSMPKGQMGVHDGYMFNYLIEKIDEINKPFFVNFFSMSSHSPYDQPMGKRIDWNDSEDDFHNSFYYSDSCLGDFMENAKTKDWYNNTLFVIVADHSHQTYTHQSVTEAGYRHIPMLLVGGALKEEYRNKHYDKICSQTDITKTILNQLDFNSEAFFWSKDLFNSYSPEFAYFEINQGYGLVNPDGYMVYDHFASEYVENTFSNDSLSSDAKNKGAAYLQTLFQEFMDL